MFKCKKCGNADKPYFKKKAMHVGMYCRGCGRWVKWIPQANPPAGKKPQGRQSSP